MSKELHNVNKELNEIALGDKQFYYESDNEYDYLTSKNDSIHNGIKVKLRFSKDVEKNKIANEGLKLFFSGI